MRSSRLVLSLGAVLLLAACTEDGRVGGEDAAYAIPEGPLTPQVAVLATLPAVAVPVTRLRWSPETGRLDVSGAGAALSVEADGTPVRLWATPEGPAQLLGGAEGALLTPAGSGWLVRDAFGTERSRVAAPVAGLLWSPRQGATLVVSAAANLVAAATLRGEERWRSDALARAGLRPAFMAIEGGEVGVLAQHNADWQLLRLGEDGRLLGLTALPGVEDPTSFQAVPRTGGPAWVLVTRRQVQVRDRDGRLIHQQPVPPLLGDGPVHVAYVPREDGGVWAALHGQAGTGRPAVLSLHDLTGRLLRRERFADATALTWDPRRRALVIAMDGRLVGWTW